MPKVNRIAIAFQWHFSCCNLDFGLSSACTRTTMAFYLIFVCRIFGQTTFSIDKCIDIYSICHCYDSVKLNEMLAMPGGCSMLAAGCSVPIFCVCSVVRWFVRYFWHTQRMSFPTIKSIKQNAPLMNHSVDVIKPHTSTCQLVVLCTMRRTCICIIGWTVTVFVQFQHKNSTNAYNH